MNKRQFLGSAALAAAALPASGAAMTMRGPALLTITGDIKRSNRGALDPVLDRMMHNQKISFSKALALDFAAITALPAVTIRPTLEYDSKPHALHGPLLLDVLALAGARPGDAAKLVLRAVDGYAAALTVAQARERRFIVATHLDGQPIPLGGVGPLWAVYDADRVPEMAAKPLPERFASCPWALYHMEVEGNAQA
ncbi:molybdopterin-dependent oxidoreductase [Massilia horti]|uniref:Molybdopterin-dependent oxidoreductase n=1 Tax=Massilia horti TaxID=2562153 RepID=A0A4Y9T1B0_9BURK|nr:molybdopterin-dependent oxidoreductase [Massilia horti]TFW32700.1 molybdopterin-dependent oxidoreductase [Massilia horti]